MLAPDTVPDLPSFWIPIDFRRRAIIQRLVRAAMVIECEPVPERPMLKLMFAATIRAAEKWRKLKVSNLECEQLRQFREEINERFKRHRTLSRDTPALSQSSPSSAPVR